MVSKESPILVIDDSRAIQAILKEFLRSLGYYDVTTADSAKEGLELLKDHPFEVVFLDMVMPGESGDDFARDALQQHPGMKIVVTTALPYSHESVMSAVSQGASDYLPKPIRQEALKSIMQRLEREHLGRTTETRDVTYL